MTETIVPRPADATSDTPSARAGSVTRTRPDTERRNRTAIVLASFALALFGLAWVWMSLRPTDASFADTEVISGNRLGTGTLDVGIGADTVRFAAVDMTAGDEASGRFVIENDGTLPMRYTLSSFADPSPLRDQLRIVVWASSGPCTERPPASAQLWQPLVIPGNPTDEARNGAIAVGESQLVCMHAELPLDATAQNERLDLLIGIDAVHDIDASSQETS